MNALVQSSKHLHVALHRLISPRLWFETVPKILTALSRISALALLSGRNHKRPGAKHVCFQWPTEKWNDYCRFRKQNQNLRHWKTELTWRPEAPESAWGSAWPLARQNLCGLWTKAMRAMLSQSHCWRRWLLCCTCRIFVCMPWSLNRLIDLFMSLC